MRRYHLTWQSTYYLENHHLRGYNAAHYIVVELGRQNLVIWKSDLYYRCHVPPPQFPVGWRL